MKKRIGFGRDYFAIILREYLNIFIVISDFCRKFYGKLNNFIAIETDIITS